VIVSGTVLDASGGAIAGAWLRAEDGRGAGLASTGSSGAGTFRVSVAPGLTRISAGADGYSEQLEDILAPVEGLRLVLAPESAIAGHVLVEGTREPVPGAVVTALSEEGLPTEPHAARTTADGAFRVSGLSAGRYSLAAVARNWRSEPRMIVVTVAETAEPIELGVRRATPLRGVVRVGGVLCQRGGVSVQGAVHLYSPLAPDGSVLFDGVPPGRYDLEVSCAGALAQLDQLDVGPEPIDRAWELERGLELRGVASSAGVAARCLPLDEPPRLETSKKMHWRHLSVPSRVSLLSSLLLLGGCNREQLPIVPGSPASPVPAAVQTEPAVPATASSEAAPPPLELPYPRAAWRLAPQAELDDVVLWFSQILIRHTGSRGEVSFNVAQWFSVPPPATRSRAQALALAQQIAQQAAADPTRFPELARQYSEDLPRREEGGAMGGVQASQIMVWPQVLDALAAIAPGQTSKVVETRYGFHVFLRSAPPPERALSGAHIIIGHDRAQWLGFFARKERPDAEPGGSVGTGARRVHAGACGAGAVRGAGERVFRPHRRSRRGRLWCLVHPRAHRLCVAQKAPGRARRR
jgi:hypothetical protein